MGVLKIFSEVGGKCMLSETISDLNYYQNAFYSLSKESFTIFVPKQ